MHDGRCSIEVTKGSGNDSEPGGICAQARSLLEDLRSPLAAIRVAAELLSRTDLSLPQRRRLVRNVLTAAGQIEEIVSDFSLQLVDGEPQ